MSDRLDRAIAELVRDTVSHAPPPPTIDFGEAAPHSLVTLRPRYRVLAVAAAVTLLVGVVGLVTSQRVRTVQTGNGDIPLLGLVDEAGPAATAEPPGLVLPGWVPEDLRLVDAADVWSPAHSSGVLQRFVDRADPGRQVVISSSANPLPRSITGLDDRAVPADAVPEKAAWKDQADGRGWLLWSHEGSHGTATVEGLTQPEARALLERLAPASDGSRFELPADDTFEVAETVVTGSATPVSQARWLSASGTRSLSVSLQSLPDGAASLSAANAHGSWRIIGGRQVVEVADMMIWADEHTLISLTATGLDPAETDRLVASMTAATPEAWAEQRRLAQQHLAQLPLIASVSAGDTTIELRKIDGNPEVLCLVLDGERGCSTGISGSSANGGDLETGGPSASYSAAVQLDGRRFVVGIVSTSIVRVRAGADARSYLGGTESVDIAVRRGDSERRWFAAELDPSLTSLGVELAEGSGSSGGAAATLPRL